MTLMLQLKVLYSFHPECDFPAQSTVMALSETVTLSRLFTAFCKKPVGKAQNSLGGRGTGDSGAPDWIGFGGHNAGWPQEGDVCQAPPLSDQ